jgi:hypothetical protein
VFVFGDKLSFLVPRVWVETDDGDDYLYHRPETDSGWLRVSLLTVATDDEIPSERLKRLFDSRENVTIEEKTGNLVSIYEKDSDENGVRIHLYYWKVANVVLPDLIREAIFSYTILLDHIDQEDTKRAVSLIGQLISKAVFSSPA